MTTGKMKIMVLAMALMLLLSGCNLVRTDPVYIAQQEAEEAARVQAAYEADMNQVVATFDGGTLTKGEMLDMYNDQANMYAAQKEYYNYMYAMYLGQNANMKVTVDDLVNMRQAVAESLVNMKIMENKLEELGAGAMTEEDYAKVKADAHADFANYMQEYREMNMGDDAAIRSYLAIDGLSELSDYYSFLYREIANRLLPVVTADVTVTDEDIQAKYEELVASDKEKYEASPADVEDIVQQGKTPYYMPEGGRFVKQIFLKNSEEVNNARTEAQKLVASVETEIADLEARQAEGEDVTETLTAKNAELEEAKKASEDADAAAWAEVQDKVDEVAAALEAGEDFETLMDKYNEPSSEEIQSINQNGYFMQAASKKWDSRFSGPALALENVGDVSQPTLGAKGIHIVKFVAQPETGAALFENVKDEVEKAALNDKKETVFNENTEKWIKEANVQYNFEGWVIK